VTAEASAFLSVLPYGLLVLGLGTYVLGFALGHLNQERTHRSPTWARMVSSATLVLTAVVWWQGIVRGSSLMAFAGFLCAGMVCSFAGDLLMARLIPARPHVLFAMLAFGAAHVLYLCAGVQVAGTLGLGDTRAWIGGVGGGLMLAALSWYALIRPPTSSTLGTAALLYALLLGAMTGAAISLAVQERRFLIMAGGAALFLVSDAILGNRIFRRNDWPLVGDVVWILYIVGQALIVFSPAALV